MADTAPQTLVVRGTRARSWDQIYVLLQRQGEGHWRADSVVVGQGREPFGKLEKHQTVAGASVQQDYVDLGIEYYDIPERLREQIVEEIENHPEEFAAHVRVDLKGRASLIGFRIRDREYRF